MTKAQEKAAEVAANKQAAYVAKVQRLLGHLVSKRVPVATIVAEMKLDKTAESVAAEIAAQEPVGRAVHPQKALAVKDASKRASDRVEKVLAELEAAGWDRQAYAPYPRHDSTPGNYQERLAKYRLVQAITKSTGNGCGRPNDPDPAERSEKGVARFIAQAEANAAFQYDLFICKMVAKVGDVTSANIVGDHIWGRSTLTVRTVGGEVQHWLTQQIVNFTKYGDAYHQWPSRKVKG